MEVWINNNNHVEEAYSKAGIITALYVAMSVSFCLPHPVTVSAFIILFVEVCVRVIYVRFGSKVRHKDCLVLSRQTLYVGMVVCSTCHEPVLWMVLSLKCKC